MLHVVQCNRTLGNDLAGGKKPRTDRVDIAGARIRVDSGVDQATLVMVLAAVRGDK